MIGWFLVDLVGIVLTVSMLRHDLGGRGRFPLRVLATFALFYGFGWLWADVIGGLGRASSPPSGRRCSISAIAVAGLWFGFAFLVIGLGAAALTVAAFLWASDSFWLAVDHQWRRADRRRPVDAAGLTMDAPDEIIHQPVRLRIMAALTALCPTTKASTLRG